MAVERAVGAEHDQALAHPDHQIDALTRAGVDLADIYFDRASGANVSRHELEKALASANRRGDQLVITRFGPIALALRLRSGHSTRRSYLVCASWL